MDRPKPKPLDQLIRKLDSQARFVSQVAEHRYLPPVAPAYAELAIHASLQEVLNKTGIQRLWSHQQEAIEAIRRGENVVVMTPTASGKTLIYNLPVLEALLEDPDAKALYVFPLKGLEQDQAEDLNGCLAALPFNGFTARTMNWPSFSNLAFSFRARPAITASGMVFLLLIHGNDRRASARRCRALRLPIITALREL